MTDHRTTRAGRARTRVIAAAVMLAAAVPVAQAARGDLAPAPPTPEVAAAPRPLATSGPLHLVYDLAPLARVLHDGVPGVPGLGSVTRSVRQHPLGDPFPPDRWVGKVNYTEIQGLSATAMARLLEQRMTTSRIGGGLQAGLVAIDELGVDAQDDGFGPRLLEAMRILAKRTHAPTGEPLSRRVLMYAAPKMVGNVGEPNDREDWDSALAAARLSGGIYLQMYHGLNGRLTTAATEAEWRAYLPNWRKEMGAAAGRLRVLFTGQVGPSMDVQWSWARATDAGRRALKNGAGAYRMGSVADAQAWLRNWNRYAR